MQYLQLVTSALLVLVGILFVDAEPAGEYDYSALEHKEEIFSKVTTESLSKTFLFEEDVDVSDTFAHILVSLSRDPREDGMYFQMAYAFLVEIMTREIASDFVLTWIATCAMISRDRENRATDKLESVNEVITEVLNEYYFSNIKTETCTTFYDLTPFISHAMEGRVEAAKHLVTTFAKYFDDNQEDEPVLKQLNDMVKDLREDILEKVKERLQFWGNGGLHIFKKAAE